MGICVMGFNLMAQLKNFNAFSCSFWKEKQLPTALWNEPNVL